MKVELKPCCGHKPQVFNSPKYVRGRTYRFYQAKCWHCKNETEENTSYVEMCKDWNVLADAGSSERRFSEKMVKVE